MQPIREEMRAHSARAMAALAMVLAMVCLCCTACGPEPRVDEDAVRSVETSLAKRIVGSYTGIRIIVFTDFQYSQQQKATTYYMNVNGWKYSYDVDGRPGNDAGHYMAGTSLSSDWFGNKQLRDVAQRNPAVADGDIAGVSLDGVQVTYCTQPAEHTSTGKTRHHRWRRHFRHHHH